MTLFIRMYTAEGECPEILSGDKKKVYQVTSRCQRSNVKQLYDMTQPECLVFVDSGVGKLIADMPIDSFVFLLHSSTLSHSLHYQRQIC
jgi:hypothetical protein